MSTRSVLRRELVEARWLVERLSTPDLVRLLEVSGDTGYYSRILRASAR